MARKHAAVARNVNARRIIESVAQQTPDDIAWQRRDHMVTLHNQRALKVWREQNKTLHQPLVIHQRRSHII